MIRATGFITAGGRSSRMGVDKAWLELAGRAMIEHVIAALAPVSTHLAIIANSPDYERLGFPVFSDSNQGIGPLEAVRTALSNTFTDRVMLVGCDMPFVTTDLFKLLLNIEGAHYATVPIGVNGKLEPLCAVYRAEALSAVTELITQGERKMSRLFDRVPTRFVPFEELRLLRGSEVFFKNINTPEDYKWVSEKMRADGA